MPYHDVMHKELVIYSDLMLWLKETDVHMFNSLSAVSRLGGLYLC